MFFGATAFAEAPFSSEGIINQSVELQGNELVSYVSSVGVSAGGSTSVTAGTEIDLESTVNNVSITADANIALDTNLLSIVLGNANVNFDSSVNLSTNLLESTVNNVSITAGANVTADTNLLTSTSNSVTVEIKFEEYVTGQQINSTVNNVDITAGAIVNLSTNLLTSTVNSVDVTAGGVVELQGQQLSIVLGDEQITGSAVVNLSTNALASTTDSVSVQIDNEVYVTGLTTLNTTVGTVVVSIGVQLTGLQMTTSVGTPVIYGWAVVDINVTNSWTVVDIAA